MPLLNPTLALAAVDEDTRSRVRSGMRAPRVRTLPAGTTLYRFASTYDRYARKPVPRARWATGPWWLDEEGFRAVAAQRAASLRAHGSDPSRALTLGFLARQAAAVKQEWSNVDVVVTARLTNDLNVFAGKGRTQYEVPDRSTGFWNYDVRFVWTGWDRITQYFLPFLDRDRPGMHTSGATVLELVREEVIDSQQLW